MDGGCECGSTTIFLTFFTWLLLQEFNRRLHYEHYPNPAGNTYTNILTHTLQKTQDYV